MSHNRPVAPETHELLSALSDGECRADEVAAACAAWRQDADARARWHAYQLIGDVLRSDDLASTAGRDAAFLARLRERLEQEPVVLAPPAERAPQVAAEGWRAVANGAPVRADGTATRRRLWAAPLTMAAGFVAVTALWVGTLHNPAGSPAGEGDGSILAWMTPQRAAEPGLTQALTADSSEPALTVDGTLLRDAELDRYLQAHHQFGGDAALTQPAGFLRSATYVPMGR